MAIGEKKQNATFGGEQAFRPGAANDGSCPRRNQRQSRQDNASTVSTDYAMHQGPGIHAAEVRLEADMMCTCHKTSWVLKAAGSVSGALPSEGHASLACRKRTTAGRNHRHLSIPSFDLSRLLQQYTSSVPQGQEHRPCHFCHGARDLEEQGASRGIAAISIAETAKGRHFSFDYYGTSSHHFLRLGRIKRGFSRGERLKDWSRFSGTCETGPGNAAALTHLIQLSIYPHRQNGAAEPSARESPL